MASELGVQTIQHTNGTDALTIGSDGSVNAQGALTTQGAFLPGGLTAWPAFLAGAVAGSAWTSVSAGSPFPLGDDSSNQLFDNGNNYNTTTYTFVAPINGIYHFNMNIYTLQSATEGKAVFALNGSAVTGAGGTVLVLQIREDAALDSTGHLALTLPLTANDEVQAWSWQTNTYYPPYSYFSGHLVAPT